MEALEFAKKTKRMCEFYEVCVGCQAKRVCADVKNLDLLIPIVEKWSAEHPLVRNVDWVAEQLKKIGYKANEEQLRKTCPVPYNGYFAAGIKCPDKHCSECRKWWDEEHREEKENGTR